MTIVEDPDADYAFAFDGEGPSTRRRKVAEFSDDDANFEKNSESEDFSESEEEEFSEGEEKPKKKPVAGRKSVPKSTAKAAPKSTKAAPKSTKAAPKSITKAAPKKKPPAKKTPEKTPTSTSAATVQVNSTRHVIGNKVSIPGSSGGPMRRVGLSKRQVTRSLSPVKIPSSK